MTQSVYLWEGGHMEVMFSLKNVFRNKSDAMKGILLQNVFLKTIWAEIVSFGEKMVPQIDDLFSNLFPQRVRFCNICSDVHAMFAHWVK